MLKMKKVIEHIPTWVFAHRASGSVSIPNVQRVWERVTLKW